MQITTNVKIIGDKMQYIKYFNTRTMLHNFKEAVNLTNQLGIKMQLHTILMIICSQLVKILLQIK